MVLRPAQAATRPGVKYRSEVEALLIPWDIPQAGDPKRINHLKNAIFFFDPEAPLIVISSSALISTKSGDGLGS